MKKLLASATLLLAASAAMAQTFTITNAWSGVSGDKGNVAGFAFKAEGGLFPNNVNPAGTIIPPTFSLDSLTLTRPGDTTTPNFGTTGVQLTSADTPVYVDIYTAYSGGIFSGYVGSSANSVTWSQTAATTPYSFNFSNISLNSSTKYWLVFSENNVDGDVANFRLRLNTSGADTTAGEGKGYLTGDTAQVLGATLALQDWAPEFTLTASVPEPTSTALVGLGILTLAFRRRA